MQLSEGCAVHFWTVSQEFLKQVLGIELCANYPCREKPEEHLEKLDSADEQQADGANYESHQACPPPNNKSKKLGFIKYDGWLQAKTSLLSVVLHD